VRADPRLPIPHDLDLAGLGLLGDRDGQREHTVAIFGLDVVDIQAVTEHELPAVGAGGAFGDKVTRVLGVLAGPLGAHRQRVVLRRNIQRVRVDAGKVEPADELVAGAQAVHRHQRRCAGGAEHLGGEPVEIAEWVETQASHCQRTSKSVRGNT
jgi:hypothetical protein